MKIKIITTFFLALLLCSAALANHISIEDVLKLKPKVVLSMERPAHPNFVLLETSFNGLKLNDEAISNLDIQLIEKVDFCYSGFKQSENFNQNELNRSRLKALQNALPNAFDSSVNWTVFEQNTSVEKSVAKAFYHGFILYYRPKPTKATVGNELSFIDDYLSGKLPSGTLAASMNKDDETIESDASFLADKISFMSTAMYGSKIGFCESFPDKRIASRNPVYSGGCDGLKRDVSKALKNGGPLNAVTTGSIQFKLSFDAKVSDVFVGTNADFENIGLIQKQVSELKGWKIPKETEPDSAYKFVIAFNVKVAGSEYKINITNIQLWNVMKAVPAIMPSMSVFNRAKKDSLFIKFFQRNKDLDNMAVVCDVTGSMSPYTAQLLEWQKLHFINNNAKEQVFCFFNDGDLKPQTEKVIGSTGGVYIQKVSTFDEVKALAYKTMRAGGGGDLPENNYEAVIKTIKAFPDTKTIIMVADNWAPPRDIELIVQVKRPMKIIVCGAFNGINPAYLNAARRSGSSIHTIEDDIKNLSEMNVGEKVTIGKYTYKLRKKGFVKI